jgi:hypothetical protein
MVGHDLPQNAIAKRMTISQMFDEREPGEPDPRQAKFRAVMDAVDAESSTPLSRIAMAGYRASHVDVGWIRDSILGYAILHPETGADELAAVIARELPRVVQRLKTWSLDLDAWPELVLSFETKDDEGTYRYELSIDLD